jgi:hypothetical protein
MLRRAHTALHKTSLKVRKKISIASHGTHVDYDITISKRENTEVK